ncbi:MAG: T9SS type A sorting domain-containing protein [Bacteroidota bacterium]|nr:T9SS type A sorting domain-containing protein [Bacteroidota bacterium]
MPNKILIVVLPTSVTEGKLVPERYSLSQNYPNPFNPITRIQYFIPQSRQVNLRVYDINGHEVAKLVNELQQPGDYIETKKMILTR